MSKRFLVIQCDDSTKWSPKNFSDMFISGLRDELQGDVGLWDVVCPPSGEHLPAEILDFQGVVITGSRFNIVDDLSWYSELCEFLRAAAEAGRPQVYGGCFGCQMIAHALGGIVAKNPGERFILKAELLHIESDLSLPILIPITDKPSLRLIESHGYCVQVLFTQICIGLNLDNNKSL